MSEDLIAILLSSVLVGAGIVVPASSGSVAIGSDISGGLHRPELALVLIS